MFAAPAFSGQNCRSLPRELRVPSQFGPEMTRKLILSKMIQDDALLSHTIRDDAPFPNMIRGDGRQRPLCLAILRAVEYLKSEFQMTEADLKRKCIEGLATAAAMTILLHGLVTCLARDSLLLPVLFLTPGSPSCIETTQLDALIASLIIGQIDWAERISASRSDGAMDSPAFGSVLLFAAFKGPEDMIRRTLSRLAPQAEATAGVDLEDYFDSDFESGSTDDESTYSFDISRTPSILSLQYDEFDENPANENLDDQSATDSFNDDSTSDGSGGDFDDGYMDNWLHGDDMETLVRSIPRFSYSPPDYRPIDLVLYGASVRNQKTLVQLVLQQTVRQLDSPLVPGGISSPHNLELAIESAFEYHNDEIVFILLQYKVKTCRDFEGPHFWMRLVARIRCSQHVILQVFDDEFLRGWPKSTVRLRRLPSFPFHDWIEAVFPSSTRPMKSVFGTKVIQDLLSFAPANTFTDNIDLLLKYGGNLNYKYLHRS
ncbi:hypothetical protein BU23DRAFT_569076 [Bimuria novae-zelandiae CBS 107.79]|uniref:Uncharacterized protein n=1 Tax=Bimuria novae-zelandiae CBS 107.79 TaxID=1447943 RepID=A0A6A5VGY9_9PLEO|nr:hypothetical protein BU23DRAFT_569076 [Bimuria novae-zelandiae CBS 107.79]